jgi:hypothetical protein
MDSIIDSLIELINSAQNISDRGFDIQAFLTWKGMAFITLFALLGPFHYYTRKFCQFTSDSSRNGLLAGEGILVAVKEHFTKRDGPGKEVQFLERDTPSSEYVPWTSRHKKWYSLDFIKRIP